MRIHYCGIAAPQNKRNNRHDDDKNSDLLWDY